MNRLLSKIRALPMGLHIFVGVILIFSGRCLWLYAQRPAHEQEIAAAYGSVSLFYGNPQPDNAGKRVTFVKTSDRGYGVFMADTATGKRSLVCEEDGSGQWGDSFDLHVWSWAPDDSSFIYSDGNHIHICDPETGKSIAEIATPGDVAVLTWLTPTAFVYVDPNGHLYQVERKFDGTWAQKDITDNPNRFALRSVGKNIMVSASDVISGADASNASDESAENIWISGKTNHPIWLQYQFRGPAWAISQYRLVSSPNDPTANPSDWQLLGSEDGIRWTVLDKQTNQKFNSLAETNEYRISNQTPYWFYRLNITATAGGGGKVCLAGFQLLSEDTPDAISANAENPPNESVAKAFDGLPTTRWFNKFAPLPLWLQYQFGGGAGLALSGYSLTSANDGPERDPKEWQFQASNDGTNWTALDTRSGEIFASRFQSKTYSFANATPYRLYRLYITACREDARTPPVRKGVQLAEFNLGLGTSNNLDPGLNPLANASCLTTLSSDAIAWAQNNCLWSMNVVSGAPHLLLNLQDAMPTNTTLHGFSYSKQTGQFLLSCNENGANSLWSFDVNDSSLGLRQVPAAHAIKNGAWISTSPGGWVGQLDDNLFAGLRPGSNPSRIVSHVNIDAFTVSSDGRQVFILGTIKDEASSGLWQYDLASAKLTCVVSDSDYPSPYALHEKDTRSSVQLPSGQILDCIVYPPADFSRQSHGEFWRHKYPLVIGNTDFGVVLRSGHGRLWIPAMTACGAYVVVINRATDWYNGIEKWGDNVTAAYNQLANILPIDKDRVYLFGVSAETSYVSDFLTNSPQRWAGVVFLNPTGLPDLSNLSPLQQRPKILLSAGGLEQKDEWFKQYQEQALQSGALVDYIIAPGQGHHFVGNASQLQRTKAMVHFVFDE